MIRIEFLLSYKAKKPQVPSSAGVDCLVGKVIWGGKKVAGTGSFFWRYIYFGCGRHSGISPLVEGVRKFFTSRIPADLSKDLELSNWDCGCGSVV